MTIPDRTAEIRARLESRKVGLVLDHHITLDISDVEYLIAAIAASQTREKELRDLLDDIEWTNRDGEGKGLCPSCGFSRESGHEYTCALKEARAVLNPKQEEGWNGGTSLNARHTAAEIRALKVLA